MESTTPGVTVRDLLVLIGQLYVELSVVRAQPPPPPPAPAPADPPRKED